MHLMKIPETQIKKIRQRWKSARDRKTTLSVRGPLASAVAATAARRALPAGRTAAAGRWRARRGSRRWRPRSAPGPGTWRRAAAATARAPGTPTGRAVWGSGIEAFTARFCCGYPTAALEGLGVRPPCLPWHPLNPSAPKVLKENFGLKIGAQQPWGG